MVELFLGYLLPFLMLSAIVAVVLLRMQWRGGPTFLTAVFFLMTLGPSLLFSLFSDDSSTELFVGSMIAAFVTVGVMFLLGLGKRPTAAQAEKEQFADEIEAAGEDITNEDVEENNEEMAE